MTIRKGTNAAGAVAAMSAATIRPRSRMLAKTRTTPAVPAGSRMMIRTHNFRPRLALIMRLRARLADSSHWRANLFDISRPGCCSGIHRPGTWERGVYGLEKKPPTG